MRLNNKFGIPPYYRCMGCNSVWDSEHTHDPRAHISWKKENDYCPKCCRVFRPTLIDKHITSDGKCVLPERIGLSEEMGVYGIAERPPAHEYKPVSNKIRKPNVNKTT
jgi:hypothetical protein